MSIYGLTSLTGGTVIDASVTVDGASSGSPVPVFVAGPTITVSPNTLPNATLGSSYSQTLTSSGGMASYSFAVTAGSLPPGLTLSSGGGLSGMPTALGTFSFAVTATDSSTGTGPYTGSHDYSLIVGGASGTVLVNTLTDEAMDNHLSLRKPSTPMPRAWPV